MGSFFNILSVSILLGLAFFVNKSSGYRLPENVKPVHYKLEILTNLDDNGNSTFEGKVWIKLMCLKATNKITLHSKDLEIDHGEVKLEHVSNKTAPSISKIDENDENEFLIIELNNQLEEDEEYILYIQFRAPIKETLAGYYLSSYVEKTTGKKRYLAVTQFEATDARRAFPCFDEPEFKAQFAIRLGHHERYSAVSNMPITKTDPIEGKPQWVCDKFEETVPMSTYLVAYMVSDFGYETSTSPSCKETLFRTWAKKDSLSQVLYANQIGPQILEYYEQFFDIKYPLPKQDMVAIPDFAAGAMENWGLITFRESTLLFDANQSSASSQHSVASVVAHELAHQWFGNLVTMKWWTDLWLNEGFATYVAGLGVHHIHPEWNSLEEEVVSNMITVFGSDALKSSHPVSVPIGHPNQINQIFDSISYHKGSAILRMMNLFLGEETFKQGVSSYLKKHKYGNAEQDDLWESLTTSAHRENTLPSDVTVKMIMDTWTLQTGYPVITVKRNYDNSEAEISQKRFALDRVNDTEFKECWMVPLSYTTQEEAEFNVTLPKDWLKCDTPVKTIKNIGVSDQWVIFNIQMAGLYKVNYDVKNWNLLIAALKTDDYSSISTLNRAHLLDDVMDLAWTGDQSYKIALGLVGYLQREVEYTPWSAALKNLNRLRQVLQRKPSFDLFEKYIASIVKPVFKRIGGLTVVPHSKRLDSIKMQITIAAWACRYHVADCEEVASKAFAKWQAEEKPDENNPIPSDLRNVVYSTAIRNGGAAEWEFLWQRYRNTDVATAKNGLLSSLGCSKDIETLKRYLNWTLDEEHGIRKQDIVSVFNSVVGNVVGYDTAKEFLFKNIAKIHDFLGPTSGRIGRFIGALAKQMSTQEEYDELQQFTTTSAKYLKKCGLAIKQALETVQIKIQWQQRNYENVIQLLNEENATPVVVPTN